MLHGTSHLTYDLAASGIAVVRSHALVGGSYTLSRLLFHLAVDMFDLLLLLTPAPRDVEWMRTCSLATASATLEQVQQVQMAEDERQQLLAAVTVQLRQLERMIAQDGTMESDGLAKQQSMLLRLRCKCLYLQSQRPDLAQVVQALQRTNLDASVALVDGLVQMACNFHHQQGKIRSSSTRPGTLTLMMAA